MTDVIQVRTVQIEKYRCPLCWVEYTSREDAEKCYSHGQKLKEYEQCLPWRWYKMVSHRSKRVEWCFASRVRVDNYDGSRGWPVKSCMGRDFRIDDTRYAQYSSTQHWDISTDAMTLADGYKSEHRLIPDISKLKEIQLPEEVQADLEELLTLIEQNTWNEVRELPLDEIFRQLVSYKMLEVTR